MLHGVFRVAWYKIMCNTVPSVYVCCALPKCKFYASFCNM
jgi:hypothetical protein